MADQGTGPTAARTTPGSVRPDAASVPEKAGQSKRATEALGVLASVVAIALIVVYIIFMAVQWQHVNDKEPGWSRHMTLFSGLEALTFAAAGALFGTTVQKQVTRKADAQASQARQDANEQRDHAERNAKDAEKGRALQNLAQVRASVDQQGAPSIRGGPTVPPGGEASPWGVEEFVALARLYDVDD